MVAQSLNQLQKTYGEKNSILDNSHIRVTYAANDEITARRISDLVGQATLTKRQKSFSAAKLLGGRSVSESEQEFARPLLTADEVLRLPYDEAILLVSGMAPYRGEEGHVLPRPALRRPRRPAAARQSRASSGRSSRAIGRRVRMGDRSARSTSPLRHHRRTPAGRRPPDPASPREAGGRKR